MKILHTCLFSSILLFLCGCSSKKIQEEMPEVVFVRRVEPFHKVVENDSIASIAKKYDMKRADLIRLNKLCQPYHLYRGQKLIITPKIKTNVDDESPIVINQNNNIHSNFDSLHQEKVLVHSERDDILRLPNKVFDNSEKLQTIADLKNIVNKTQQNGNEQIESEDFVHLQGEPVQKEILQTKPASEYSWPIANGRQKISKHFGEVDTGVVIDSSAGTAVVSIADGEVAVAGVLDGDAAAYGKTVIIRHDKKKKLSIYSHLKEISTKVGSVVKQGEKIGLVGKSGNAIAKAQLYFEINDVSGAKRNPIDPEKLLPKS